MQIAYLHGFQSGPKAIKAQIFEKELKHLCPQTEFVSLDFPDTPKEALAVLKNFCIKYKKEELCLVGSSMGGFLAAVLHSIYGFKAALINPCVHPQDFCQVLLGKQYNPCTDTYFEITKEMIEYLKELDKKALNFDKESLLVLLQTGDEVLNYKKSEDYFKGCNIKVTPGGSHAYDNFEKDVPLILSFFHLL